MPESQEPGIEKDPRERKLSLKDRIEANKGAGYGAMVGAVSGAIFLGPLAPDRGNYRRSGWRRHWQRD